MGDNNMLGHTQDENFDAICQLVNSEIARLAPVKVALYAEDWLVGLENLWRTSEASFCAMRRTGLPGCGSGEEFTPGCHRVTGARRGCTATLRLCRLLAPGRHNSPN